LLALPAAAGDCLAWEVGGQVTSAWWEAQSTGVGDAGMVRTRLSVTEASGPFRFEFAPEMRLATGAAAEEGHAESSTRQDLSWEFADETDLDGTLEIDRLWASADFGRWQATVGRQPVGFGTSLFWAPTDLVAPFAYLEPDRDTRPGSDALRLLWAPGNLAVTGLVWAAGEAREDDVLLAHARFPLGKGEGFLIGGRVRGRPALGGSLQGEAGGIGLRAEGVLFESDQDGDDDASERRGVVIAGADYRFAGGAYLAAEYLYCGTGSTDPGGYEVVRGGEAYRSGLVPFAARQYLFARVSRGFNPLATWNLGLWWNLDDGSALVQPQVGVSLADDLDFLLMYIIPAGSRSSEFGGTAPRIESRLSWHF
jgi:hypothetical protein